MPTQIEIDALSAKIHDPIKGVVDGTVIETSGPLEKAKALQILSSMTPTDTSSGPGFRLSRFRPPGAP